MVLKASIVLNWGAVGFLVAMLANVGVVVVVEGGPVSPEDSLRFAEAGHPMFRREPAEDGEGHWRNGHERHMQQKQGQALEDGKCTQRTVVVKESEYDVDYKDGDFQIGVTPLYRPGNVDGDPIGNWWWDWAVFRGTDYERSYGTMMIEYSDHWESLTFGFSVTQTFYPITGGCV
jgi:hypothetical protein